jgi:hypothetical protein
MQNLPVKLAVHSYVKEGILVHSYVKGGGGNSKRIYIWENFEP